MKFAAVFLVLALATSAFASRDLLQNPAPAPSPDNCPAKQSASAQCLPYATTFQTQCAAFITALNTKTGGQVTATTDAQITALVGQLKTANTLPTSQCCTAAQTILKNACMCDTNVQAVAKSTQNLTPSQFQTVGKVFSVACGQPTCIDTCQLAASN